MFKQSSRAKCQHIVHDFGSGIEAAACKRKLVPVHFTGYAGQQLFVFYMRCSFLLDNVGKHNRLPPPSLFIRLSMYGCSLQDVLCV